MLLRNKLFGTDGIREKNNFNSMNPIELQKLGIVIGSLLIKNIIGNNNYYIKRILISIDFRYTSNCYKDSFISGLNYLGIDIYIIDNLPSPIISFLTSLFLMDMGFIFTASHNDISYNGLKFFFFDGTKICTVFEKIIEFFYFNYNFYFSNLIYLGVGSHFFLKFSENSYILYLRNFFYFRKKKQIKIIIDCSNGLSEKVVNKICSRLNIKSYLINKYSYYKKINNFCGVIYLTTIKSFLCNYYFDFGFIFDGDSDRLIFIRKNGSFLNGDFIILFFCFFFKRKFVIDFNFLILTKISSNYLDYLLNFFGFYFYKENVGEKNVLNSLIKNSSFFGAENSGHFIFLKFNFTSDPFIFFVFFLFFLFYYSFFLSNYKIFENLFYFYNNNINYDFKTELKNLFFFLKTLKKIFFFLPKGFRIYIRKSGTENKIRFLFDNFYSYKFVRIFNFLKLSILKDFFKKGVYNEKKK